MKEQEFVDTTASAESTGALARKALGVAKLAPLRSAIEVAITRTLFDTCIDLQVWAAVLDIGILRVAAKASGSPETTHAVLAGVVALRVDCQAVSHFVNHVVECIIDVVEGGHLE